MSLKISKPTQLPPKQQQEDDDEAEDENEITLPTKNATNDDSSDDEEDNEIDITDELRTMLSEQIKKQKQKKVYANDELGLKQRMKDTQLKNAKNSSKPLPWIETLTMSVGHTDITDPNDDLNREKTFYDLSLLAANMGLDRLMKEGIPYNRPTDFFAEMIKTDDHMSKVKGLLLKERREIDEAQKRTKLRIERKFSRKAQSDAQQLKQREKKEEQKAIKKWRTKKGGKGEEFPEELLDKHSELRKQYSDPDRSYKKSNRQKMTNTQIKALKYGMGGKKRGLKSNTSESTRDMSQWDTRRNRNPNFKPIPKKKSATGASSSNRPGKRKRQQGWTSSGGKKVKRQKK